MVIHYVQIAFTDEKASPKQLPERGTINEAYTDRACVVLSSVAPLHTYDSLEILISNGCSVNFF